MTEQECVYAPLRDKLRAGFTPRQKLKITEFASVSVRAMPARDALDRLAAELAMDRQSKSLTPIIESLWLQCGPSS